jgi:hypothetical protein
MKPDVGRWQPGHSFSISENPKPARKSAGFHQLSGGPFVMQLLSEREAIDMAYQDLLKGLQVLRTSSAQLDDQMVRICAQPHFPDREDHPTFLLVEACLEFVRPVFAKLLKITATMRRLYDSAFGVSLFCFHE